MERENDQLLPGRHRKNVKSATSWSRIGLLEVLAYFAAIVVVVGSVVSGWDFNLLIALIMLAVLYAVLRDVRSLTGLKTPDEPNQPSETMIPLRKSSRRRPLAATASADVLPTGRSEEEPGLHRVGACATTLHPKRTDA